MRFLWFEQLNDVWMCVCMCTSLLRFLFFLWSPQKHGRKRYTLSPTRLFRFLFLLSLSASADSLLSQFYSMNICCHSFAILILNISTGFYSMPPRMYAGCHSIIVPCRCVYDWIVEERKSELLRSVFVCTAFHSVFFFICICHVCMPTDIADGIWAPHILAKTKNYSKWTEKEKRNAGSIKMKRPFVLIHTMAMGRTEEWRMKNEEWRMKNKNKKISKHVNLCDSMRYSHVFVLWQYL